MFYFREIFQVPSFVTDFDGCQEEQSWELIRKNRVCEPIRKLETEYNNSLRRSRYPSKYNKVFVPFRGFLIK